MPTETPEQIELDSETKALLDDLVRDMGLVCVGIDGDEFLEFETYSDVPRDEQGRLASDVMQLVMGSADEKILAIRDQTRGISIVA